MKGGYETDWHVLCCSDRSGACSSCARRTIAYVMGFTRSYGGGYKPSTTHKNIWMRFCPLGMDPATEASVTGLTIFHELMHMTSIVGDGEYSKRGMVKLARSDPYKARINSASYTMYIA